MSLYLQNVCLNTLAVIIEKCLIYIFKKEGPAVLIASKMTSMKLAFIHHYRTYMHGVRGMFLISHVE